MSNAITFGFIGTFGPWHGIAILESIIPPLLQDYKQVHFLLVGDGALLDHCKSTLAQKKIDHSRVLFTGLVEQHKAVDYLRTCDVFLCPTQPNPDGSEFFGSPTKLFEYMSMGKPIIASRIGQVAEIVDETMGILVDPLDVQGFIVACKRMIEAPASVRSALGNAARKKVVACYTWKQHVTTIIKCAEL